jgi:hypothetical protein
MLSYVTLYYAIQKSFDTSNLLEVSSLYPFASMVSTYNGDLLSSTQITINFYGAATATYVL